MRFRKSVVASLVMSFTAVLAACDDDASGPSGPVVNRAVDEPPGANCSEGGTALQSGVDDDEDGILDDAEVATTTYACRRDLVRLVDEPAGPNCADGGTAVRIGDDANANDVLEPTEIRDTVYLCETVHALVTRVTVDAAGAPCAEGAAIEAGFDLDDDGVLADSEVLVTEYACGAAIQQGIVIKTPADAEHYRNVRVVARDVLIHQATGAIELPQLAFVGGTVSVSENNALTAVHMPQLTTVDGSFSFLLNPVLTAVRVPRLAVVNGAFFLHDNPALTELPTSLRRVDGNIEFAGNALESIDLSNVDTGQVIGISDNPALKTVILAPSLSLEVLQIFGNARLESVDFTADSIPDNVRIVGNAALRTLRLNVRFIGLAVIRRNPALTDLAWSDSGPTRISTGLAISNSPITTMTAHSPVQLHGFSELADLHMTKLLGEHIEQVSGDLVLHDNPLLTEFHVRAGGSIDISDNPVLETATVDYAQSAPHAAAQIKVANNGALENFSALALASAGTVSISQNPVLTAAGLPSLLAADKVAVTDNAALPVCQILALFDRIASPDETQANNHEAGVCP